MNNETEVVGVNFNVPADQRDSFAQWLSASGYAWSYIGEGTTETQNAA